MSRPPYEGGPAIFMSKSSLERSEPSYRQPRWYEYLCIDFSRCQPSKSQGTLQKSNNLERHR